MALKDLMGRTESPEPARAEAPPARTPAPKPAAPSAAPSTFLDASITFSGELRCGESKPRRPSRPRPRSAVVKRQRPDGSWRNDADRWLEGEPVMATVDAVLALEEAIKGGRDLGTEGLRD